MLKRGRLTDVERLREAEEGKVTPIAIQYAEYCRLWRVCWKNG